MIFIKLGEGTLVSRQGIFPNCHLTKYSIYDILINKDFTKPLLNWYYSSKDSFLSVLKTCNPVTME